jgi:hypothetical protein
MRISWPQRGTKKHKNFFYLVFVLLRAFLWLKFSGLDFKYPRKVKRHRNMQWHWDKPARYKNVVTGVMPGFEPYWLYIKPPNTGSQKNGHPAER